MNLVGRPWLTSTGPWGLLRVLAALLLLWLAKLLAALLLPLACAGLLVLILSVPAEALQRRRVPAGIAAAIAVFGPAMALATLVLWTATPATRALSEALVAFEAFARPLAGRAGLVGESAGWALHQLTPGTGSGPGASAGFFDRFGPALLPLALETAVVSMLAFFGLMAQRSVVAGLFKALPQRRTQVALLGALGAARDGVARWFATSAVVNLGLGAAMAIGLAAIGLPGAVGWGLVSAALLFIPYLGPLAIMLLLAAAGSASTVGAVTPPALFFVLHAIEANFVSPWWMGQRLRVARPMLLLAVQVGAFTWGLGGAVLAVPLLIVAHAVLRRWPIHPVVGALLAPERSNPPSLEMLAASVLGPVESGAVAPRPTAQVRRMPDPVRKTPDAHRVRHRDLPS